MKLKLMVELEIPDNEIDVNRIEEAVYEKRQEIGRQLLIEAMEEIEEKAADEMEGIRAGFVNCYWITRVGIVRIRKQRMRKDGKSFYPLDRVLGCERACTGATEWVKRRGVELSCDNPYRKAAEILGNEIGASIGRTTLHRFVREAGQKYSEIEKKQWLEMREKEQDGPKEGKDLAVIEIDATYIHQQRRKWQRNKENLDVKLGIIYTGRERFGKNKYRLKDKVVYGGIEGAEEFGEKLWLKGEEKLNIGEAKKQLVIGDGDSWIKGIKEMNFPEASYQVDWWHVTKNIRRAMGSNEALSKQLISKLYEGKGEKIVPLLSMKMSGLSEEQEEIGKLLEYLRHNEDGFYGNSGLSNEIKNKVGSGAIEKNIELVIGRRFKKWGMSWSKDGANYLLKLRILKHDREAWNDFWKN
ncbi:MAG: UPF0236 family protein [Candidatus Goldbacteria bacterium]|nr:UPF0236 family protein [Candidatus Goldiibacteriota bacterium]